MSSVAKLAHNAECPNNNRGDADTNPKCGDRRVQTDHDPADAGAYDAEGNEIGEYRVDQPFRPFNCRSS
jgi:hypothetical protein